jgi:hypothetical protein
MEFASGVSRNCARPRLPRFESEHPRGAVEVEVATRVCRLQRVELDELRFNAHLEAVLAPDFREVVGELESLADFVRRQEAVAAQGRQSAKVDLGKAAVFRQLLDTLNSVLSPGYPSRRLRVRTAWYAGG